MTPHCRSRLIFTVIALLPAAFQLLRPELSFDPLALILTLAITVAWLAVLIRRMRDRLHEGRVFDWPAVVAKLPRRHRAIYK